jgi:hypothetical protein
LQKKGAGEDHWQTHQLRYCRPPAPASPVLPCLLGAVGLAAMSRARSEGNVPCPVLEIDLLGYLLFVEGWALVLAVGLALTGGA